jgi:hypothetical protein
VTGMVLQCSLSARKLKRSSYVCALKKRKDLNRHLYHSALIMSSLRVENVD